MILNPAIIALILSSLLITFYAVYASFFGLQIIRHWDIHSGSERQLTLERRTYLISTLMASLFGLSLFSAFLFIYTADRLHILFVGAMCAAGTLNVNAYGYPLLVVKILNFFLCGLWLILNHADAFGTDYPLIKPKYRFMAVITVLLAVETLLTFFYFGLMRADVITSCCGTLFSTDTKSVAGDLAALPSYSAKVLLFVGMALLMGSGIHFLIKGKGALFFGWFSAAMLVFSLAAIIAFISVYYYQLPSHHCPFDMLQSDYHYIGYPLYAALFTGGAAGTGVALVDRYKCRPSLQQAIPKLQKRLCLWSMIGYTIFIVISVYPMIFSDFRLEGY